MGALESVSSHTHHRHCVLSIFADSHKGAEDLVANLSVVGGEGCLDLLTVSL